MLENIDQKWQWIWKGKLLQKLANNHKKLFINPTCLGLQQHKIVNSTLLGLLNISYGEYNIFLAIKKEDKEKLIKVKKLQ
jgi:hypothetical protein